MKTQTTLLSAKEKCLIVQFRRTFEPGTFTGFVMDIGPEFFLLASLGEGFEFEQYVCLRVKDVRGLECPAKRVAFYEAVRKRRGDTIPPDPKLDLTSRSTILASASPSLVTIHREKQNSNTCKIGYALSSDKKTLEMLEIDTAAKWDSKPTYFKLQHITRVDLPGPYERALLLVGGKPKLSKKKI